VSQDLQSTSGGILVIDDDPDLLAGLTAMLEGRGFHVHTAASAEEGWSALLRYEPEVLLVDWNLPGQDGVAFIRRLRADDAHRHLYAVMVTARSDRADLIAGMEAGADDYLTKPFDNEELLARVRVGMRTRALERELTEQVRRATVLEMAGSLAHEIGNPLASAKLILQRLRSSPAAAVGAEARQDLHDLDTQLQRIEILVRRAQALTRVDSKTYAADLRIIDLDTPSSSSSD
jgi:DNA-binding response OmpR family regulator